MSLTGPQSRIFHDLRRFRVVAAGRRFGKTTLAIPELERMVWGHDREAWYIAPSYRQAKQIFWRPLKKALAPYTKKLNESELSIELAWGSRVALKSGFNYDSLRGNGLNGVIFDEYADIPPEAWTEVVRAMLSDKMGTAMWIGTPKGRNHFYELGQMAKVTRDWAFYSYTTLQGGNVPPSEVEAARRDLDEKTFRQEYEASFENYAGSVYYAFDREYNCAAQQFNPLFPVCWSLDFNNNPMASVIGQIEDRTTRADAAMGHRNVRLNVLDEIVLPQSNIGEVCRLFLDKIEKLAGGRTVELQVYGDAAGSNKNHTGQSDWEMVWQYLNRTHLVKWSSHVPSADPLIKDRVNAMNSLICSYTGERRLFVDPKCKELVKDLEQVGWKEDASGNNTGQLDKSDPARTHVSDALGYLVHEEFGLRGSIGFRQERIF